MMSEISRNLMLGLLIVGFVFMPSAVDARHNRRGGNQEAVLTDLRRAVDDCMSIAIDLKRYLNKDLDVHRHAEKKARVERRLRDCLQRARDLYRQVRNVAEAAEIMSALSGIRFVIPIIMFNPCQMVFVKDYLCLGGGSSVEM